jgi:pyruvate,orthophosphate dikinase
VKVEPQSLDQLAAPDLRPQGAAKAEVAAKGLPASPGAATGAIVFTADEAVAWTQKGSAVRARAHGDGARRHPRHERGAGVLTATGGMTSHAAVVGRQMGKPSVVRLRCPRHRRQGQDARRSAARR